MAAFIVRVRRHKNVHNATDSTATDVSTAKAKNKLRSCGANNSIQLESSGAPFANIKARRPARTPLPQTQYVPSTDETDNWGHVRHVDSDDANASGTRSLNNAPEQT